MNNTKVWFQSKTILGIILTAIIMIAGWFGVIPEALPESVQRILELVGLIIATYGRAVATKSLK